jgi:hypothetical protein
MKRIVSPSIRSFIAFYIPYLFILIFIDGCHEQNPIVSPENNNAFAIYFLKDTTLTFQEALSKNLTLNDLADKPWITQDDIEFYDWSSHCIYLKKNKESLFPEPFTLNYGLTVWWNKILVVVCNGEICYKISGRHEVPPLPEMTYVQILIQYPDDVLNIWWPFPFAHDERNNGKVKKALIDAGLLHNGLQVDLDSVSVVENTDSSTAIEYTFTLTNNDSYNLYVFDPDKTGSNLFHQYTNGIDFLNTETGKLYKKNLLEIVEPAIVYSAQDSWSPDWFTKLETGKSIQRSVALTRSFYLPSGEYELIFRYNGPYDISKEDRILSDGKYKIGDTRSNYLFIDIASK